MEFPRPAAETRESIKHKGTSMARRGKGAPFLGIGGEQSGKLVCKCQEAVEMQTYNSASLNKISRREKYLRMWSNMLVRWLGI